MSTAQSNTVVPMEKKAPAAVQIQGRVDAAEGRRLFGWVWDRSRPTEHLLVRVLLEGRMVASGTADMVRVDLRRNGIGDGSHAFEVELPEAVEAVADRLTVVAVSTATNQEVVLQAPSQSERAAEAAVSGPLNKVLDRLELLIEAQRRSQLAQREASQTMRSTAKQIEEMTSQEDGIGAALEVVRANQTELSGRMSDNEVFLMRFDKVLSDFDKRIEDLTKAADRPMRRAATLLIALGGISAVSTITTLIILLRHGGA
jgi:hypothetical protein